MTQTYLIKANGKSIAQSSGESPEQAIANFHAARTQGQITVSEGSLKNLTAVLKETPKRIFNGKTACYKCNNYVPVAEIGKHLEECKIK